MTPAKFWLLAATWGSYMTGGDPGACMYGFDDRGMVQSEAHRQQCLNWICVECVKAVRAETRITVREERYAELIAMVLYLIHAPMEKQNQPVPRGEWASWPRDMEPPHGWHWGAPGKRSNPRRMIVSAYSERTDRRGNSEGTSNG